MSFQKNLEQKNTLYSKRTISWFITVLILTAIIFLDQKTAHAGLFSFVQNLFSGGTASAQISAVGSTSNSQTLVILESASNPDPNPGKSFEITPILGDTLIADIANSNAVSSEEPVNTQVSLYVVRAGDSLSEIAKMFGVSVNTIVWANNISRTSPLKDGQTLLILPVSGISYTIKKGDTLKGIIARYKADEREILQYNDLSVNSPLIVGQTIIIPDVELQNSIATKIVYKGSNPAHDTNGPAYDGYYIRPIRNGFRSQDLHGYNGIDLADRIGTPIYASAPGTVIVSVSNGGWNGGYGNFIIISHSNGTQTLYSHNYKNLVRVGDFVDQGQQIATMGATGHATGPHVHFEVRGAKNPCTGTLAYDCRAW